MSSAPAGGGYHTSEDEKVLHRLGYAQELFRAMGGFQNFAISFTIISILAGCLTSYYIAFGQGGPIAVTWGWLLVGLMSTIVALAMAEIASAFPTAGGLYYWASKLGSPAWGWFTGWFNLIGQIAVTAAIGYGLATFGTALLNFWFDYPNTKEYIFLLYIIFLAAALVINLLNVQITALLNTVSAYWHMAGVLFIVLVLAFVPDNHQSFSYVFGETVNATGFGGDKTTGFVFIVIIFLMPPYKSSVPWADEFSWEALNYAPILVGGALILFGGWYLLSAHKWFKGPVRMGTEEELERMEARGGFNVPPESEPA